MTRKNLIVIKHAVKKTLLFVYGLAFLKLSIAGEWTSLIGIENYLFFEEPIFQEQEDNYLSAYFEMEYINTWDNDNQSFVAKPYFRWDKHDDERTHIDFRELLWTIREDDWAFRAGITRVFWGVTEFYHLVNIINQSDLIENPDGEDKLGQPMLNFNMDVGLGTLDLYLLLGFRERTFPGSNGRFQLLPNIDVNKAEYESSKEDEHIDWAARWYMSFSKLDIGLSYFEGTNRTPSFKPKIDSELGLSFTPRYEQIEQVGLDVQAIFGDWLWKLEALKRNGENNNYFSFTGGFEYTFVGAFDTAWDIGAILEYMYDERKERANTFFQDDLGMGLRFAANDVHGSEVLLGIVMDQESDTKFWSLEASRRLGQNWKLDVQAAAFSEIEPGQPLYFLRRDNYFKFAFEYFF